MSDSYMDDAPKGVTIVRDRKAARRAMNVLRGLRGRRIGQDVETIDIDPAEQSPVHHGRIICFSMYAGKDVDFGNGPMLWVDTLDGVDVEDFAEFFEDPKQHMTAHNWGFDFHQIKRGGATIRRPSIQSDTLHTSRLLDAGRLEYSLESLTEDYLGDRKVPMKELFGKHALKKNGEPGKVVVVPPLDEIQRDPEQRNKWILYSTGDTRRQLRLDHRLLKELEKLDWRKGKNLRDFYEEQWKPFCYTLLMMEQRGVYVNAEYLAAVQPVAEGHLVTHEGRFKRWASKYCDEAVYMNPGSDQQLQVLLFGGSANMLRRDAESAVWANKAPKDGNPNEGRIQPGTLPSTWTFEVENVDGYIDPNSKYKKPKVKRPMTLHSLGFIPDEDEQTDSGWPKVGGKILDRLAGEPDVVVCAKCKQAIRPPATTCEKHPDAKTARKLGAAAKYFKGRKEKYLACKALQSLAEAGRIGTMLSNFIEPLQTLLDSRGRVHTSINLNTMSGRLSSKRPNSQNQPANEKDRYGIRDAFEPEPLTSRERKIIKRELRKELGRAPTRKELRKAYRDNERVFIVSDFSNLELRVAAHVTNCISMIEAFEKGGDFHSRTAVDMFTYVAEAVERGDVVVDWNEKDGPAPKPTVKQAFPFERSVAKVFNFSILYGKTVYGLSKDLNLTEKEAQNRIDLWFSSRPEVKMWIDKTIQSSYRTGYTKTLYGRRRPLPQLRSPNKSVRKHGERAAINTPIQGGAADIVVAAMNRIERCPTLRKLKARMLLQIHDELIMEVPRKNAKKAQKLKVHYMSHPFGDERKLRVELKVDSNIGMTWKEAK